jgi:hypothetical protein
MATPVPNQQLQRLLPWHHLQQLLRTAAPVPHTQLQLQLLRHLWLQQLMITHVLNQQLQLQLPWQRLLQLQLLAGRANHQLLLVAHLPQAHGQAQQPNHLLQELAAAPAATRQAAQHLQVPNPKPRAGKLLNRAKAGRLLQLQMGQSQMLTPRNC